MLVFVYERKEMSYRDITEKEIRVPYSGLGSLVGQEDVDAVKEALAQGNLCSGYYVKKFEDAFADYVGAKHAISCSNCTTALELVTAGLGLKSGDEVITTPLTFIATSLPLLKRKVRVVFADIDPLTFNLDPDSVARMVTSRTKAIYVVHYAGLSADMDRIMAIAKEYDLKVIEDAAHASGSSYKGKMVGGIGDATCFSFQSLKNMTTLGDGGMITTNDEYLASKIRRLKTFGILHLLDRTTKYGQREKNPPYYWDVKDFDGEVGLNYRMSEPEAAVGLVQLKKLNMMNSRRIQIATKINEALKDIPGLQVPYEPEQCKHVYHLYTLLVNEDVIGSKDDFMQKLDVDYGIDTWLQYCPNYLFTIYRNMGYKPGICPVAEDIFMKHLVNLPIYPSLTDEQVDYMIDAIRTIVA